MKAKATEILKKARDIIANRDHWAQMAMAIERDGRQCPSSHVNAVRWCISGALQKSIDEIYGPGRPAPETSSERIIAYEALAQYKPELLIKKIGNEISSMTMPEINDHPMVEHTDILEWLDCAIKGAGKE